LQNLQFLESLRVLGFKIGKVSTFLKNIAPAGSWMAVLPTMASGATFCLNWHTKGHCWSHCGNIASHTTSSESNASALTLFVKEGLERIG
jgi:hypothetical protein